MKTFFLLFTFILISSSLFAQQLPEAPTLKSDYYITKSKKQKKTGFILLSGFVAVTALSQVLNSGKKASGFENRVVAFGALGGLVCMAACPVFFVTSLKNKKKGKREYTVSSLWPKHYKPSNQLL